MPWSSRILALVAPAVLVSALVAVESRPPESALSVAAAEPAATDAPPTPVVGDFDADGRTDLFWYGPGDSDDHLWYGAGGRRFHGAPLSVRGDYLPLTGDFNGDGNDDVFWYGSGAADDYLWFGATGRRFVGRPTTVSGAYQPFVADFDGDHRDDVFWYAPGVGADRVWYGTAAGTFTGRSVTFSGTQAPVVGDFDGSGTADIVWYGEENAPDALWQGKRSQGFTGRPAQVMQTYAPGVGDFNGDRRDDIFWFGPGSTPDVVWSGRADGTFHGAATTAGSATPPLIGDFDANGAADLFWYQPGTAADALWFGGAGGLTPTDRTVNGTYAPIVGDFDADQASDIIWYAAGAPADPLWYGTRSGGFTLKSSIVDIHPALAPPVDQSVVTSSYDQFGVLAHEMGPTPEGGGYTSSREAFDYNYARGFRVFEADFVQLADGSVLAAHDGLEDRFRLPGSDHGLTQRFGEVTRAQLAGRFFHSRGHDYTPLFSEDVVALMRQHPDIYVVLDTKDHDAAIFARFMAHASGDPAVMERLVPHIYSQLQLDQVQDLYPVHSYMVALYRNQYYNRWDDDDTVAFVRRNRGPAVMMWSLPFNPSLSLRDNMAQRRRYSDEFASRLARVGAVVYVHSVIHVSDAVAFRAKGVGIYSSGPFPPYSERQPQVFAPEDGGDEAVP